MTHAKIQAAIWFFACIVSILLKAEKEFSLVAFVLGDIWLMVDYLKEKE